MAEAVGWSQPYRSKGAPVRFGPRAKKRGDQMKIITKLFLSLCLVGGLGATLTSTAQIESDARIRANIPYSFVVNNTTLPAGSYEVTVVEQTELNTLEIRSTNGKTAVVFETDPTEANRVMPKSELVFDKIGDTYFLSRVFLTGDQSGNQLPKSKMLKKLEAKGLKSESRSIAAVPIQGKSSKQTAKTTN